MDGMALPVMVQRLGCAARTVPAPGPVARRDEMGCDQARRSVAIAFRWWRGTAPASVGAAPHSVATDAPSQGGGAGRYRLRVIRASAALPRGRSVSCRPAPTRREDPGRSARVHVAGTRCAPRKIPGPGCATLTNPSPVCSWCLCRWMLNLCQAAARSRRPNIARDACDGPPTAIAYTVRPPLSRERRAVGFAAHASAGTDRRQALFPRDGASLRVDGRRESGRPLASTPSTIEGVDRDGAMRPCAICGRIDPVGPSRPLHSRES